MPNKRFLGITVMTPFIQTEGVEGILNNVIGRAGATAVAINTSVVTPSAEGEGVFQPPDDAGASVRLFDRPLWGKHALWVRSGPGHAARNEFFEGLKYQPRQPNDLTRSAGAIVRDFITAAKDRGLKVYVQTSATAPPGLSDEDRPRLPDGRLPQERMADTGSPASADVRLFNRAWVRDIFVQYPQIDGIRPDWPEYPCYKLDEAFQGFEDHSRRWVEDHDFDFERMRREVDAFYDYLHGGLTNRDLEDLAGPDRGKYTIFERFNRFPGVAEWLRFKAALSTDLLRDWQEAIYEFGGPEKELSANAFMPPFSQITGLDFAGAASYCASIAPKLYTMHWSLMVEFWGRLLLERNPGLDERLLVRALVHILDLADEPVDATLADYGYPEPDEPHPIPTSTQQRKIAQVLNGVRGQTQIYPLVHGYGPLDDFRRRFQLVADSPADGAWINRYGYLSDEKLDAVGEIWGRSA
jgi:hypothetical protein